MDRLSQLRGEAGGSRDTTLDTTSPPSEAFLTANESSSKFYSLSEVDSTFDISSIKDDTLETAAAEPEGTMTNTDELISNLSPIRKKGDPIDSYKIDTQIEAANILSGGVDIFDDNENDNSCDGHELVIDDNVDVDDKSNSELRQPDSLQFKAEENIMESSLMSEETDIASKDTEVVLQIDGKNVDAIDIGNGLYLYRKEGQEELAAVQIIDDDQQQPSFKFLKVRENAEGNLEVYEEIEIEVPKEVPPKEGKTADKNTSSHVPIKDINKVISESTSSKVVERKIKAPKKEPVATTTELEIENKETSPDGKTEVNLNGKMMKFSESRKSPVIGSFTPMTYHSTPNKEGIPLTKTMVDQQLHPNRHSDLSNVKKTIEVHTDNSKPKVVETPTKNKDVERETSAEMVDIEEGDKVFIIDEEKDLVIDEISEKVEANQSEDSKVDAKTTEDTKEQPKDAPMEQDSTINSTEKDEVAEKAEEKTQVEDIIKINDGADTTTAREEVVVSKVTVESQNIVENKNSVAEKVEDTVKKDKTISEPEKEPENKIESIIDEPMEIDTETELTIVDDTNDTVQNSDSKALVSEKTDIIEKVTESVVDNKQNEIKDNEPILIEDDDDSVVEEVIVENEKEIIEDVQKDEKLPENDINKPVENIDLKDNKKVEDVKVIENKETTPKNKEETVLAKTSTTTKELPPTPAVVTKEEMKVESPSVSEVSKDNTKTPVPIKSTEAKIDIPAITTTNVQKDEKGIEIKHCVNEAKAKPSVCLPLVPADSKKSIEVLENKNDTPKEKDKPADITTISPVLEQKECALPLPKVPEKTLDSVAAKPSSSIANVVKINKINKSTEQKMDSKVIEKLPKQEPVKVYSAGPVIAPQVASSHVSISIGQSLAKVKPTEVKNSVGIHKNPVPQPVKTVPLNIPHSAISIKPVNTTQKDEKKNIKVPLDSTSEKGKGVINIEISKVPKLDPSKIYVPIKQDVSSTSGKSVSQKKIDPKDKDKNEVPKVAESKPINNNHAAVPFGKWTDANRQEFLNKFVKAKTSVTSTSSNQLKNSNDLNRRDVLKKIDSQRQTSNALSALSKTQEASKLNAKPENAAFSNKPNIVSKESTQEAKVPPKTEKVEVKPPVLPPKKATKTEIPKPQTQPQSTTTATGTVTTNAAKKENAQRTEVVQNLIDKTIEGMIHRTVPPPPTEPNTNTKDETKQNTAKEPTAPKPVKSQQVYQGIDAASYDALEMKMNELHGIPFIERPPHELPQIPLLNKPEPKTYSKVEKEKPAAVSKTKIPNLLPFPNKNQPKSTKDSIIEVDSEDEIIEHEPITGDIDLNKKNQVVKPTAKETLPSANPQVQQDKSNDASKKDPIITEKDFDKFARRNSITYENRLTVNFDGKESANVIQTVVEKDVSPKNYSRKDSARVDPRAKPPHKYQNMRPNTQPAKTLAANKYVPANDDASNRNQSKLQKAYHSALTAKRQMGSDYPITIIEDKPVKVVFVDNVEYLPSQLNTQGQDLTSTKKPATDSDIAIGTCDSPDVDNVDSIDAKTQEEIKIKSKHQRKQVLNPVVEPELELIEPSDLGIEGSPKKKRKTEDDKTDKSLKYPRKKMYLLGSSAVTEEKVTNPVEVMKNPLKESINLNDNGVAHKSPPVSALDSLVKAAELIETQTENINSSIISIPESQPSTPVKRGRGRPRKYPLTPDGTVDKSKVISPSPQKKPRLIDAKPRKREDPISSDSDSDEDAIIKENWTMGKINENIVCPICNKLFRTENVVFKHVKHCTGPSPSRSDSDKRSPRRMRVSQDFDTKSRDSESDDMDIDDDKPLVVRKKEEKETPPKKRKSKDSITKSEEKDDIIVIEDTPIKEKPEKVEEKKVHESRKPRTKIPHKNNNLVCEFCGKTFRQLSYLVSHKLQHKKTEKVEPKKTEKEPIVAPKSVYSCEVCKKEFRKLHHLVQHRIIHNPSSATVRPSRKSSSEQSEGKHDKEQNTTKQSDDPSAGFRCEPCDKSFRKLHHLVEHRETHDGKNRQKVTTAPPAKEEKPVEKPVPQYNCDVCKKTFKNQQHLNEHKEQHVETSSEKSDDKSVKSCLSTKDIIHECSLCYMVFPNEHSLNKHTIICQRKKRQSKQTKPAEDAEGTEEVIESPTPEEKVENDIEKAPKSVAEDILKKMEVVDTLPKEKPELKEPLPPRAKSEDSVVVVEKEKPTQKLEVKVPEPVEPPAKRDFVGNETVKSEAIPEVPEKIKKVEEKSVKIQETPKRRTPMKEKAASSKKPKTTAAPKPKEEKPEVKTVVESSDDDEVRYMLNPNFKVEEVPEEKAFMKVRAKKRSSLQIERPNSKDLMKRRTSLQHPPKIPRLKPKAVETQVVKKELKAPKLEPVPSTDSDDSETTKYSFPSTVPEKQTKIAQSRTPKDSEKKVAKKSLVDKRKFLSGIAKRKSLGKAVTARHKASPLKPIKKRTLDVEHRCDCGQLFSSAALLSRHTTLAHTPPRIRRRRSPPPDVKPAARKSPAAKPPSRKSSARSDSTKPSEAKPGRKSVKSPGTKAKPEKSEASSSVKPKRTAAHRGVPVPDQMRKLMNKNK